MVGGGSVFSASGLTQALVSQLASNRWSLVGSMALRGPPLFVWARRASKLAPPPPAVIIEVTIRSIVAVLVRIL